MVDEQLLVALSQQVIDDRYALSDLLRKCIMLGARTGSDSLRTWAQRELNGYDPDEELPNYRRVRLPLVIDTTSGLNHVTGQIVNRIQAPKRVRHLLPEDVEFRQSIDAIDSMARADKPPSIAYEGFPIAAALWTEDLPPYQSVDQICYKPTTSTLVAIVGSVRTVLTEIIADLVQGASIELPSKDKVDQAVNVRIYNGSGDHNEVSVETNTGAIAAGESASAAVYNSASLPPELLAMFTSVRDIANAIDDDNDRTDIIQAIEDLEGSVVTDTVEPERVQSRGRALSTIVEKVGVAALTVATTDLTTALLTHLGLG